MLNGTLSVVPIKLVPSTVPELPVDDHDCALLLLVREKLTGVSTPEDAATLYGPPAVALAVKEAEATPLILVATVIVAVLFEKMPLAPVPGAVKVTLTLFTGLPPASLTVTASGLVKAVLIAVL